jgi:outer membrane receptor for ferrienterochelin and colicin
MRGTFGLSLHQQLIAGAAFIAVASASPAEAQTRTFDVPAEAAAQGIPAFARQAGVQIIASGNVVRDRRTNAVQGAHTVEEGLRILLSGTGLAAGRAGATGIITIVPSAEGNATAAGETAASKGDGAANTQIVVTGTRIKGAPPTSPVIRVTQEDMRAAGQNTVADVFQSIPQNFNGGQNPGVLLGASIGNAANNNATGASTINLRGLGPDATLTLLNGRRLAYNSSSQGVDVSVIPAAALDRIEIVADGASAIYGSDAVAGVANIVLKKDYSGVALSARLGTATDGGDFQQQYGAVAGTKWSSGGFIATYDYLKQNGIFSNQRSYTSSLSQPYVLLPPTQHSAVVFSGHQDIGDFAQFKMDALYGVNQSTSTYTILSYFTAKNALHDEQYIVSPTIEFTLPRSWTASLNGTYGKDIARNNETQTSPLTGAQLSVSRSCFCNQFQSVEANANGPLLELPGGAAKAVVGAGYRKNRYQYEASTTRRSASQSSRFAYFEFYLPFIGEANRFPLATSLSLNVAGRFERYRDFGTIFTPKLGGIYEIIKGLDLRASWGKSFKAPTLDQQATPTSVYLYRASTSGGSQYPSTSTVLYAYGGRPELQPERATTWTATLDVRSPLLKRVDASLSYFDIAYRDRIIAPFTTSLFLSTPSYADFLTYNPTLAQQQAIIAGAPAGLVNLTGAAYDPTNVVAIADGRFINAAVQTVRGVDFSLNYSVPVPNGSLRIVNSTTYLHSSQQNSNLSPIVQLAGMVNYPPKWRSRTGLIWTPANYQLSSFISYISGITDASITPAFKTKSMTTADFIGSYRFPQKNGAFRGFSVTASVLNAFNSKPPFLYRLYPYIPSYDSTNYSAVGRFVSVTLAKSW